MFNCFPEIKKGITAFIGSGGKTSLIHYFCKKLSVNSKVIFCTTTQIFPSESIFTINNASLADIERELSCRNAVCIGRLCESTGKFRDAGIAFNELKKIADYVLVEADGSKGLPIKAHADYEPVIPDLCDDIILVIGASGFGRKVKDTVHRKEIFCTIAGCSEDDIITPELAARVLNYENLADKVFVNQVDSDDLTYIPKALSALTDKTVYYGSVLKSY